MGADIHWAIERQHKDGAWEPVLSEMFVFYQKRNGHLPFQDKDIWEHPVMLLGNRSYDLFGLLSNVRGYFPGERAVANPGIPDNASPHCRDLLAREGLHTQGWLLWSEIEGAAANPALCPAAIHSKWLKDWSGHLSAVLADPNWDTDTILFGRPYGIDTTAAEEMPDLVRISGHEILRNMERSRGLQKITPETVRIIFAYDS